MNEEYFRLQTDLEKMRSYQKYLMDSITGVASVPMLHKQANEISNAMKMYVVKEIQARYSLYINKMRRECVGDKQALIARISESIQVFVLNKSKLKAYKSGLFDLNIEEITIEVDPIRDIELNLDDDHPLSGEYRRNIVSAKMANIKMLGMVAEGDEDPEGEAMRENAKNIANRYISQLENKYDIQHPFYLEYDARTTFRANNKLIDNDEAITDDNMDYVFRKGDVFEPTCFRIPKQLWVTINPGLFNHMASYGYITVYARD